MASAEEKELDDEEGEEPEEEEEEEEESAEEEEQILPGLKMVEIKPVHPAHKEDVIAKDLSKWKHMSKKERKEVMKETAKLEREKEELHIELIVIGLTAFLATLGCVYFSLYYFTGCELEEIISSTLPPTTTTAVLITKKNWTSEVEVYSQRSNFSEAIALCKNRGLYLLYSLTAAEESRLMRVLKRRTQIPRECHESFLGYRKILDEEWFRSSLFNGSRSFAFGKLSEMWSNYDKWVPDGGHCGYIDRDTLELRRTSCRSSFTCHYCQKYICFKTLEQQCFVMSFNNGSREIGMDQCNYNHNGELVHIGGNLSKSFVVKAVNHSDFLHRCENISTGLQTDIRKSYETYDGQRVHRRLMRIKKFFSISEYCITVDLMSSNFAWSTRSCKDKFCVACFRQQYSYT